MYGLQLLINEIITDMTSRSVRAPFFGKRLNNLTNACNLGKHGSLNKSLCITDMTIKLCFETTPLAHARAA